MQRWVLQVILSLGPVWLSACVSAPAPVPELGAPFGGRPAASSMVYDACVVADGSVRCSFRGRPMQRLPLPFKVRAAAVRAGGGVYLLGESGELLRVDGRGKPSGLFETAFTSLSTTRDHVCGTTPDAGVLCARDGRSDRTCPGLGLAPFFRVALPQGQALLPGAPRESLCVQAESGESTCVSLRASCETVCLAYPACSAPRCIDPCPLTPSADQAQREEKNFITRLGQGDVRL